MGNDDVHASPSGVSYYFHNAVRVIIHFDNLLGCPLQQFLAGKDQLVSIFADLIPLHSIFILRFISYVFHHLRFDVGFGFGKVLFTSSRNPL